MPARSTRRSAASAIVDLPSPSPKTPRSSSKRKAVGASEQSSPTTRQSKRVKSDENLSVPLSTNESTDNGDGIANHSQDLVPQLVKTDVEQESELSMSVKREENDVEKEGKPESTTVVTGKTSKKRKTKEEKEAEAMPLRVRTQGLRMFVGAHVSAAKGVFNSVNNSVHIGGNAFALFLKSQRKWDNPPLQDDHKDQFRQLCRDQGYDGAKHILPHGSYLVNLAQEDKTKAKQAYSSFLDDLHRCEALGISLYNFHPGSANKTSLPSAITRLAQALTNALSATTTVTPVLETMCGQGTTIGGSLTEFRDIIAQIPTEYHPRIGICIDTCHSHAAGYDLVTPSGFQSFLQEFDDVVGLKFLRALHLNDSKTPRSSHRDLHANIGTGFLGLRTFHNIMNEPRLEGLPMILETPIDKPASAVTSSNNTTSGNNSINEPCASEAEPDSDAESKSKKKKQPAKKAPSSSTATIADPNVWAREIALLESLIGMDPVSSKFQSLERDLADEGRVMREKHLEQFERKGMAEEKKKAKDLEKGQKSLADMMGSGKAKKGEGKR